MLNTTKLIVFSLATVAFSYELSNSGPEPVEQASEKGSWSGSPVM